LSSVNSKKNRQRGGLYIYIAASRSSTIPCGSKREAGLVGRSGPNLEPGTMRVYVSNGRRNGLEIGWKVGLYPGGRKRWVLGSIHAFFQAVHAANHTVPGFRLGPDLPSRETSHAVHLLREATVGGTGEDGVIHKYKYEYMNIHVHRYLYIYINIDR